MFTGTFPDGLYIHAEGDVTLFKTSITEYPVTHNRISEYGIAY